MQEVLTTLNTAFQLCSTGSNNKVKQGEQILYQLRQETYYPRLLVDYFVSQKDVQLSLRGAIEFKLWAKNYQTFEEYKIQYYNEVMPYIKIALVQAYFTSHHMVSIQLRPAIVAIATRDFPLNWPTLITDILQYLLVPESVILALKLIRKLTQKYEYLSRSDPLYEEIIMVCNQCHGPLLQLSVSLAQQEPSKELKSLLRIFYNLNYQDLHPLFEDNVQHWMALLKQVLQLKGSSIAFKCKGEAMRDVFLYTVKYRDDFQDYIIGFSTEIWQVCTTTTEDQDCDKIVLNALKYFKQLIQWPSIRQNLESNISNLVSSLIVKNIGITSNPPPPSIFIIIIQNLKMIISQKSHNSSLKYLLKIVSLIQEEGRQQNYIKHQQGSFLNRYCSLLAIFCKQEQYLNILCRSQYIALYQQNQMNIPNEIILINLIIDGCVVSYISRKGAIETALSLDLIRIYYMQVLKPTFVQIYQLLQAETVNFLIINCQCDQIESKISTVLLAFQFRFIFFFRNHLEKSELTSLAQIIAKFSNSKNLTLQRLACYTVQGLLTVTEGNPNDYQNNKMYFTRENVGSLITPILEDIYSYTKRQTALEPYSLKCIETIIRVLQQDAFNFVEPLSDLFLEALIKITKEYEFSNVVQVFESKREIIEKQLILQIFLALLTRQVGNQLQQKLLQTLDILYRENKCDVLTFVLQIYSLLVRIQTNATKYYEGVVSDLLNINNWSTQNQELFQAYICFLEAWFLKNPLNEIQIGQFQKILERVITFNPAIFSILSQQLLRQGKQWVLTIIYLLQDPNYCSITVLIILINDQY